MPEPRPDPLFSIIGERIQLQRKRLGLQPDGVAARVGVHKSTVHDWERGETAPKAKDLVALCQLFEVSADYLLGRSEAESGLPANCWCIDLDWLDALRRGEDPTEKHGEYGAFAIPVRASLVTSVEYQRIAKEVEVARRRRGRR